MKTSAINWMFLALKSLVVIALETDEKSEASEAEHHIPDIKVPLPLDDLNPHRSLGSAGKKARLPNSIETKCSVIKFICSGCVLSCHHH